MKRMILTALTVAFLFSGCAAQAAPATETASATAAETQANPEATENTAAVTFTDDRGREVTVAEPQRVAVLIGSFADIWCLAGGGESLAAAANDAWTSFEGLPLDGVINIGSSKDLNLELLIASYPDFIIASCNTALDLELEPTFESMGVPTAYFEVSTFDQYLHMLEICTQITGDEEAYQTHGTAIQSQIDAALARVDGSSPKVLYIRSSSSSCKVKNSEGSVLGEMLHDMGCVNIADSDTGLLENLSMEAIMVDDPDAIFLVYQSADPTVAEGTFQNALGTDPAWASLRAVKEGRVYVMDQKMYNLKPNAKWGDAYEKLADILYPVS